MTQSATRQIAALAIVLVSVPVGAFAQTSSRDVETSTSVGPTAKGPQGPRTTDGAAAKAPAASDRSTATGGNPGDREDKN